MKIQRLSLSPFLFFSLATGVHAGTIVPIANGYFGDTGTPPTGWADVDGTPSIRTFNAGGQRMISTNNSAYQARQVTGTAASANTTYLLEFDQGFAASGSGSDDYTVQIGTNTAGFTSLGSKSGTVTSTGGSANFASDNAIYNSFQVTTGSSVSGNLAVQLEIAATGKDWLGYDNVHLTAFAENEIVIGNHSFDMTTRDNQGAGVGGINNLGGNWTEISSASARGFFGSPNRGLIGDGVGDTFSAEQILGASIATNTAYSLTVDIGFMQSGAGITGDYLIQLGTSNSGIFTMLAELDSSLTQTSTGEFFMADGNTSQVQIDLETGEVVSGDQLAIRLTKEDTATFFGFDEVGLTFAAVPEPSSAALFGLGGLALALRRRR